MVWFQCEDCGENVKKPKLQSHFRTCSAGKLSCIDCGVVFNWQSVQNHTQCVSEAEKYGPKAVGSVKEALKTKPKEQNRDESGLDTSLGLSTRAPWSCSFCNVKATSQETLLLHSQGKKHRSKARAISKLPTKSGNEFASNNAAATIQTVLPVLHNNSFDLVDCNAFGTQSNVLEEKSHGNPDSEIKKLRKENTAKLLDIGEHQEESGLNNTSFLYLHDTDGNSVEQEKERRKKRKVSNDGLKPIDFEKSDKKRKQDGEDARRKADCTSLVKQEKTQRMHVGLSRKGCRFENGPSAIALDRSSRKDKNAENNGPFTSEKSVSKKMNRPVESSEPEESDVSWEDLKDVSGGLVSLKKKNKDAHCFAYNQTTDSSHENWSNLVKWKKLIRRAFKNASNGSLTVKLLRKSVLPYAMRTLEISGFSPDEKSVRLVLDRKINTYRKLIINGKKVSLAEKNNAE